MAPTICTEKMCRVRNSIQESRRRFENSSSSSSVISYAGKITHRRSIKVRNSIIRKFNTKMYDIETTTTDESDCRSDDDDENDLIPKDSRNEQVIDIPLNENNYDISISDSNNSNGNSDISSNRIKSDSAYDSNSYYITDNDTPTDIIARFKHSNLYDFNDDNTQSTILSSIDDDQLSIDTNYDYHKKNNQLIKKQNKCSYNNDSKGLLDIAMKTITLIKRNQLLQKKLSQLQYETRVFIESVLANPENHKLRDKIQNGKKIRA